MKRAACCHSIRWGRHFFDVSFRFFPVIALVAFAFSIVGVSPVWGEKKNPVATCFEGSGRKASEKGGAKSGLARSLWEMKAGPICEPVAEKVIRECLTRIDQSDDAPKDYYGCIGIAANPCIDSAWATNEFRRVVCVGAEEKTWLNIIHASLDKLKTEISDKFKPTLKAMEDHFFAFRNNKCSMMREAYDKEEPLLAYGACTTETAARFAIDLRDMVQAIERRGDESNETEQAKTRQDSEKTSDQSKAGANADGKVLGSKKAPVRSEKPGGEHAYLRRLRCPDGKAPSYNRVGSMGHGGYGNIVDLYSVRCDSTGETHKIYMDMYHPGYVEKRPVPGFTLAKE
ncbi:MAG: hypothetical protein P8Y67_03015 [Alphaproteobacteria bacterium]